MRQGWRWFGPEDPVTLDHVRQAGATDIVSALHDVPSREAWTAEAVARRRRLIEDAPAGRRPLRWSVVESIPVPDEVMRLGPAAGRAIDQWLASLEAVAAEGPRIVCYNFMPIVDWTRTDLDFELDTGATALRFDHAAFLAFDIHILRRDGAAHGLSDAALAAARERMDRFSDAEIERLTRTIAAGLPGATSDAMDLGAFRERVDSYAGLDADGLRAHLVGFLGRVAPVAEQLGVRLTLHPDDPPRPLFGVPRVASTEADYEALFAAVPSPANGMCFCTGSLGARADNDLVGIARRFAPRIAFAHLRSTRRDPDGESFHESDHLDGDFDMIAVLRELLAEDRRRSEADRVVFRPDHGHRMLDDLGKDGNPGYWGIGRLKGLAELRGAIRALT